MRNTSSRNRTRKLVGIALFSAIVVVLQLLGAFIRLGQFSVSLVLIPIVVGSAVYGMGAGTWLGFMFGFAVMISGDAASFIALNPAGTFITVLLKGILAGLVVELVPFEATEDHLGIGLAGSPNDLHRIVARVCTGSGGLPSGKLLTSGILSSGGCIDQIDGLIVVGQRIVVVAHTEDGLLCQHKPRATHQL